MTTSSNSFSGGLSMSTEAIRCPKCNGVMVQGFIIDFQGSKVFVASATGSREHRVSPPGLVRVFQLQRKSAFQWVPSAVRCAASWNPMRTRNLLPSDQACRPKANPPNCISLSQCPLKSNERRQGHCVFS